MKISRREFLVLTAGIAAGCNSVENGGAAAGGGKRTVNAGAVANYAGDGVYAGFRNQGFFIVHQGERLFAVSAICTHRKCKLDVEPDHSFHCPCHGSTFDAGGHMTHGPARQDLPVFATSVNESGELLVTMTGQ
jgi:Rieske Fe-S protein